MVQTKLIQLTPADIYGLYDTPKLILPAPPIGYVNNILGISHDMEFNSSAYHGGSYFIYGKNTEANNVFNGYFILNSTHNINLPALKLDASQSIFSTTKDLFLTTDAVAADGDSNINAYIIYEQIQLT